MRTHVNESPDMQGRSASHLRWRSGGFVPTGTRPPERAPGQIVRSARHLVEAVQDLPRGDADQKYIAITDEDLDLARRGIELRHLPLESIGEKVDHLICASAQTSAVVLSGSVGTVDEDVDAFEEFVNPRRLGASA